MEAELINTFAVIAVSQSPTAPFMSSRTPFRIYRACTGREYTCITVLVVARSSSYRRQSKGLNMAARKPDREDGLFWMECEGEELRRERECAKVLEHFCCQGMIQWMDVDEARSLQLASKFLARQINPAASRLSSRKSPIYQRMISTLFNIQTDVRLDLGVKN
jgi:hypothetical protein